MPEDPDLKISVTIPHQTMEQLRKSFGPYASADMEREAAQRFACMGLAVLSEWVTGSKRYRTLTEQYIDWVERAYTGLLPKEEAPSTDRIYNSLNIPHGQVAYIARVLAAKTLVHWRTLAADELRAALQEKREDAQAYIVHLSNWLQE